MGVAEGMCRRLRTNGKIKTTCETKENADMLWTILVILLVLWLLGLVAHVGGGLIHLLLVVALVIFVINLLTGRRTV
jgi:K+-transporting ATPase A subunit